jgi:hypothetical protein
LNKERLENIFFSVTLYLESMIFKEDSDEDETQSPEETALSVIEKDGLSLEQIEGSFAILHNIDKQLYVYFEENKKVYIATVLEEFDGIGDFIAAVKSFDTPKGVKIREVSPNVGGWIDTHYGFKFKIEFLDSQVGGLEKMVRDTDESNEIMETETPSNAVTYITDIMGIDNNHEEAMVNINHVINEMERFYLEAETQVEKYHDTDNLSPEVYHQLYKRGDSFYFGAYQNRFYAVASIDIEVDATEQRYMLVYTVNDIGIEILCETDSIQRTHLSLSNHFLS